MPEVSINHRVACSTYGYAFLSLEGALKRIADCGFETVDINGSRPHLLPADYPPDSLRQLEARINDLGLRVCAISPFDGHPFWHFTAANPRHRAATVEHVKSSIDVAAALGAEVVQVVTGTPLVQDVAFDVAWSWARDGLRECSQHAETKQVVLALEGEENNVVRTSADIRRMIGDVDHPHLKGLLDIGHAAHIATDDPLLAVDTLGADLLYVHAHDNDGTDDDHSTPGDGIVDWEPLMRALDRIGYRGDFALELLVPNPDGASVKGAEFLSAFLNRGAGE